MEQARLLIAIVLSAAVFLVWQFFFVDRDAVQKTAKKTEQPPANTEQVQPVKPYAAEQEEAVTRTTGVTETAVAKPACKAKIITVDTPLYRAKISEKGAGFTSFILKNYKETVTEDSPLKEIIPQESAFETVLVGYDGKSLAGLENAVFSANLNVDTLSVKEGSQKITFSWTSEQGVIIEKTYSFSPDSYMIGLDVTVKNGSDRNIQDKLLCGIKGERSQ